MTTVAPEATKHCAIDESGEDYLYSASRFYELKLPAGLLHALADKVAEP